MMQRLANWYFNHTINTFNSLGFRIVDKKKYTKYLIVELSIALIVLILILGYLIGGLVA